MKSVCLWLWFLIKLHHRFLSLSFLFRECNVSWNRRMFQFFFFFSVSLLFDRRVQRRKERLNRQAVISVTFLDSLLPVHEILHNTLFCYIIDGRDVREYPWKWYLFKVNPNIKTARYKKEWDVKAGGERNCWMDVYFFTLEVSLLLPILVHILLLLKTRETSESICHFFRYPFLLLLVLLIWCTIFLFGCPHSVTSNSRRCYTLFDVEEEDEYIWLEWQMMFVVYVCYKQTWLTPFHFTWNVVEVVDSEHQHTRLQMMKW